MKFLVCPRLAELTGSLNTLDLGDRYCIGRLEAYSDKRAGDDKHLASAIEKNLDDSPAAVSPLGDLGSASTRKLLVSLISTLNHSFPDYDFRELKPSQFEQERIQNVIPTLNQQLLNLADHSRPGMRNEFWSAVDEIIDVNHCEIFSLTLDDDSSSQFARALWSSMLFFYNKKVKKVVLFWFGVLAKLHKRGSRDPSFCGDSDDEFGPSARYGDAIQDVFCDEDNEEEEGEDNGDRASDEDAAEDVALRSPQPQYGSFGAAAVEGGVEDDLNESME